VDTHTEAEQAAIKVRAMFLTQCARCNPHAVADYVPAVPDVEARESGLHGALHQPQLKEVVWQHLEANPDAWADMLRIFLRASTGQPVSGDARGFVVALSNKISGVSE
jgi:hypothetical protein